MRRTLLLLVVLTLAWPASADAARRQVPQGWLGVVVDGPLLDPAFAGNPEWDNLAGSGAESVRAAIYWRQIQPTGPADANFAASDAVVLAAARRGLERPAGGPRHARLGGAPPRRPRLAAARSRRLCPRPDLARHAVRTERLVMGRAPRGREAAHPRVADLERAEPDALLERRSLGAVLREAAEGRRQGAQEGRPTAARRRSSPGCRTRAGRRWRRSTTRAPAARSTSRRCTRTRASPRT